MHFGEKYERLYSSFVDEVMEIANGSYAEKREAADKLWTMVTCEGFVGEYNNLQEDVRTAVEELEDLCQGRDMVSAVAVLLIAQSFLE